MINHNWDRDLRNAPNTARGIRSVKAMYKALYSTPFKENETIGEYLDRIEQLEIMQVSHIVCQQ